MTQSFRSMLTQLGCGQASYLDVLTTHGIPSSKTYRNGDSKVAHLGEQLREAYLIKGMTLSAIGRDHQDCSASTVWRALTRICTPKELDAERRRRFKLKAIGDRRSRKLSAHDVINARRRYKLGDVTVRKMSETLPVTPQSLAAALCGESWSEVDAIESPISIVRRPHNRKLDRTLVTWMHEYENKPLAVIAEELGVSTRTINEVYSQNGRRVRPELRGAYDHTVHHFVQRDGREEKLTRNDLVKKHDLSSEGVSRMVVGKRQSYLGWTLAARLTTAGFEIQSLFDSTIRKWRHVDGRGFEGTSSEFRVHAGLTGQVYAVVSGKRHSVAGWFLVEQYEAELGADAGFEIGRRRGKRNNKTDTTIRHWINHDGRKFVGLVVDLVKFDTVFAGKSRHKLHLVVQGERSDCRGWSLRNQKA